MNEKKIEDEIKKDLQTNNVKKAVRKIIDSYVEDNNGIDAIVILDSSSNPVLFDDKEKSLQDDEHVALQRAVGILARPIVNHFIQLYPDKRHQRGFDPDKLGSPKSIKIDLMTSKNQQRYVSVVPLAKQAGYFLGVTTWVSKEYHNDLYEGAIDNLRTEIRKAFKINEAG